MDAAVVFARVIVELDADPVVRGKGCLAEKADGADAAVAQLDLLANG